MVRLTALSRLEFCGYVLLLMCPLLLPGQVRSVAEGVYSPAQAARGQQLYKTECAACHGVAMDGASGPPLTGDNFLSNWSAQPLKSLVDKIQKTMPFNLPGSLSRSQSTDLVAQVLQAGKFPAG